MTKEWFNQVQLQFTLEKSRAALKIICAMYYHFVCDVMESPSWFKMIRSNSIPSSFEKIQ